jgi:hypothetical protein
MVWLWIRLLCFKNTHLQTTGIQSQNHNKNTKQPPCLICVHVFMRATLLVLIVLGSGLVVCTTWMPIVKWGSLSWEVMIVYSCSGSKEDSGEDPWWIWGCVVTMTSNDTPQCRIELKVLWEWGFEKTELTKLVIMNDEIFVQIVDVILFAECTLLLELSENGFVVLL